jgi:hypothetical protein
MIQGHSLIYPVIDKLVVSHETLRVRFELTKTTSSNVRESKISVSGGGGGLMLDLTPVFAVMLIKLWDTALLEKTELLTMM